MTCFFRRKSIPFFCLALLVTGTGYARSQEKGRIISTAPSRSQVNGPVKGQISSEKGEPLPGVTVLIKGTTTGTATDASGRYALNAPDNATLVISFIGYNTQEVVVGNRSTIDVALVPDSKALEEVVVVGYGTVRKSDLTGSVSSIKGSAVREFPVVSVDQALQGRAAGVQVSQSSAAPGGGLSVRVRGSNSINSGSEPLYVIDGFPMYPDNNAFGTGGNRRPANAMASLNPNDIESIEVLKDASATSIYGSRGSNGVILITTKRGKEGEGRLTYEGSYSSQHMARGVDMLNGADYARYINELERTQGGNPRFTDSRINEIGQGTNWMDEVIRRGSISNHQLTFAGGSKSMRYSFMANHLDNDGIILNTFYKRSGFRVNLDNDFLNGRATLSNSWSFNRSVSGNAPTDRGGPGGLVITALGLDPTGPVYDQNGNYNFPSYDQRFIINPVALAKEGEDKDYTNRLFGSTALTFKLAKGLNFKTSLGADVVNANRITFYNSFTRPNPPIVRQLEKFNRSYTNVLNENILSYNKELAPGHQLDATVGYTYQHERNESVFTGVRDLPSDNLESMNLQNGNPLNPTSGRVEWALESVLGRLNYNLLDRYLLTLTVRRDGSSKFGPNNKWATFPSAALGWRVVNEEFFKNSGLATVFSDLKFRGSYGLTGNSQIPVYRSTSGLVPYNYVFGNVMASGYGANRIPNPDLKWESTAMANVGLDIALLNNRLGLTFDAFHNKTTDLLLDVSIPQSTGFSTVMLNSGSLTNKGLEFAVDYKLFDNEDFKWNVNGNVSVLRNKILDLGQSTPFFAGSTSGHLGIFGSWVEAGQPIGVWRGYQYTGNFQSEDEAKIYSAKAGDPKYEDVNQDGKYTADDYKIIGNPNPKFSWGFNSAINYKNFDFSLFLQGVQGNQVRNLQQSEIGDGVQKINQVASMLTDSWTPQNTTAGRPAINGRRDFISFRRSSYFIEDGSFIRLQNVSLGYTIPVTKYIKTARVYASGQNLFLITQYSGFDPEVNNQGQNSLNRGDDYDAYPRARTFTLGLSLGF